MVSNEIKAWNAVRIEDGNICNSMNFKSKISRD